MESADAEPETTNVVVGDDDADTETETGEETAETEEADVVMAEEGEGDPAASSQEQPPQMIEIVLQDPSEEAGEAAIAAAAATDAEDASGVRTLKAVTADGSVTYIQVEGGATDESILQALAAGSATAATEAEVTGDRSGTEYAIAAEREDGGDEGVSAVVVAADDPGLVAAGESVPESYILQSPENYRMDLLRYVRRW